jgi:hypothetical protein
LEEMPPEIRRIVDEALASDAVAGILKDPMHAKGKIIFNDKEYDSAESMPAAERAVYESAIKAAGLQQAGSSIRSVNRQEGPVSAIPPQPVPFRPIVPESSLSVRWLFAAVAAILGILVGFYFLFSQ